MSARRTPPIYYMKGKFQKIPAAILWVFFFCSALGAEEQTKEFKAAWWLPGGHLQSIFGDVFRSKPKLALRRERLATPDGDFLNLDWLDGDPNKPLVIVMHGLGSSAHVSYVLSFLGQIQKAGWRAVAVNARGSDEPNVLLETSHGGKSEDLDFVVSHIIKKEKPPEIYLAGYSLGGNVVLKWLGERGRSLPKEIKKAVVVSVPYDLEIAAKNLDTGFNREVYTRFLLGNLKKQARGKASRFPGVIDLEKVNRARTFKEYDNLITAKLNGFKDELEYWHQSSSANYLSSIQIPVLLIHAENDPFFPKKDLPFETIKSNPKLKLILTPDGGHLGFVSGRTPFAPRKWLEETVLNFFDTD